VLRRLNTASGITLACAPALAVLCIVQFADALGPLLAYRVPPDLGYSPHARVSLQLLQVVCIAYLWAVYGLVLLRWDRLRLTPAQTRSTAVVLTLATLVLLPANSSDVLEYLGFGRLVALYHLNPYDYTYGEVTDAFASLVTWEEPMPYGPVVLPLFAFGAVLTKVHVLLGVYGLKALWGAIHLTNAWFVWRIAQELDVDADYALFAFACNPLILWEQVGNGHNDGLLMLCGLAAVLLVCRGYGALAVVAAFLALEVKAPGVFWLAGIVMLLIRTRRTREAIVGLAWIAIACAALFVLIPGALSAPLSVYSLWQYSEDSLHTLIITGADWLSTRAHRPFDYADAFTLDRQVSGVVFALVCAWRMFAIRDNTSLVREVGLMLLLLVLGYATSVQPWYVAWLIPIAALTESPVLRRTILVCGASVVALYAFPYQLVEVGPSRHLWTTIRLLVAFGAPIAVCLRERLRLFAREHQPAPTLLTPIVADSAE